MSFIFLTVDTNVSANTEYKTIRVKISISKSSIPIVLDGEYIIAEAPSISLSRGSYTISIADTNKVRIRGNGIDRVIGTSVSFTRQAYSGSGNNHLTIKGTDHGDINYLGNMVFTVSSSTLLVVNHLPLEEYLYGVVAYEMSNSFPLEALKAQAVSARGYAANRIRSSGTYDLGDTPSDQVYKGYNPAYKRVIQAVNETKGQVLTYNGKIISTFYAASNGGQTELPGNTWGGGAAKNQEYPYLVQKDDPYDLENKYSLYQKIFVPKNVVGSEHDAITSGLPGDYIVQIVNLNTYCNVREGPGTNYSIVGRAYLGDTYTWLSSAKNSASETWHKVDYKGVPAYIHSDYAKKIENRGYIYENPVLTDLQNKAYEKLKSAGNNISKPTDVKINTVNSFTNGKERWPGTGSRSYVTANANVTVQYHTTGSNSLSSNTTLDLELQLMKPSGSGYSLSHEYLNSNLRLRGVSNTQGGYYITNGRYGHGVGMSQRGAQTMAADHNKTHEEILAFYFQGTKLTNINTTVPELPNPGDTPGIASSKYTIKNSNITGLSTNLKVSTFTSNISVQNGTIQLVSPQGALKTSGVVATGDKLQLKYKDSGNIYKSYSIVIYGDVNGDGDISIVDLLRVQKHLLKTTQLSGPYYTAGDVSKDGSVTVLDLLRIQKHLLGTTNIKQ